MTPYTFEGVTVGGRLDVVRHVAGYLGKIKPRNSDTFISMAEQAGATGSRGGVGLIGAQLRPAPDSSTSADRSEGEAAPALPHLAAPQPVGRALSWRSIAHATGKCHFRYDPSHR
jgi:hypothetical protein